MSFEECKKRCFQRLKYLGEGSGSPSTATLTVGRRLCRFKGVSFREDTVTDEALCSQPLSEKGWELFCRSSATYPWAALYPSDSAHKQLIVAIKKKRREERVDRLLSVTR